MRPRLLFLTNGGNSDPAEDAFLAGYLRDAFEVVVSHPLDCIFDLSTVDGVLIRNIWPTHDYQDDWDRLKARLRDGRAPVYNPLTFLGDIEGKDYLVDLYRSGFPVIPSVDTVDELAKLPPCSSYWIKPKYSCDGIGAEHLSRKELLTRRPKGYIIQPFLEFESEPSFFFVDNEFQHALTTTHRLRDDTMSRFTPSPEDLGFARTFIEWAAMPYGVQRIDAVRLRDGRLLLTEVENLCPFLYLADLPSSQRANFLARILESLQDVFTRSTVGR